MKESADWKLEPPEGKSVPRKRAKLAEDGLAGFAEFWKFYPRKVARAHAFKMWQRLTAEEKQAALAAIPNHVKLWQAEDRSPTGIPHAGTWLNPVDGRRWEDEIEEPVITAADKRLHIHNMLCFERGCPFDPIRRLR